MRCNGSNWAVYSPGSWDGFRNDVWALWAGVIMRLEHHLVGGYVRYISPYIIIIIRSIRTRSTITYAHKVHTQRSLNAKVAFIKALDAISPLEGYDVNGVNTIQAKLSTIHTYMHHVGSQLICKLCRPHPCHHHCPSGSWMLSVA